MSVILRGWLKNIMVRTGPTALNEIQLVKIKSRERGGGDILDINLVSNSLGCRSTYECKDAGFRGRTTD